MKIGNRKAHPRLLRSGFHMEKKTHLLPGASFFPKHGCIRDRDRYEWADAGLKLVRQIVIRSNSYRLQGR
jgi:hypothetical protein